LSYTPRCWCVKLWVKQIRGATCRLPA